jgi:hypothetical protein
MTALHPNQHDSHAARRQRWACDRCGEQPLSSSKSCVRALAVLPTSKQPLTLSEKGLLSSKARYVVL